jgi:hypothetical protein
MFDKLESLKAKGNQMLIIFPFKPTTGNDTVIKNIVFLHSSFIIKK